MVRNQQKNNVLNEAVLIAGQLLISVKSIQWRRVFAQSKDFIYFNICVKGYCWLLKETQLQLDKLLHPFINTRRKRCKVPPGRKKNRILFLPQYS
jgi:hypothetical protein